MSFNSGPVLTAAGAELLARALTGEALKFTTMQMGDGELGDTAISTLTALISPASSVGINTLRNKGNYAAVSGYFTNAELTAGFYWREIGLFVADPDAPDDRSKDILYCYQNAGSLADYIPASDSELITKRINIAAIVSNAVEVSAVLESLTSADMVSFDPSNTKMNALDVQAAIEELYFLMGDTLTETDVELIAERRAKGLIAHNLVSDGGFECGTAYWQNPNDNHFKISASDSEYTHGHIGLRIVATAGNDDAQNLFGAQQVFSAKSRIGHIIYFTCMAKAAVGKTLSVALGYGGAASSSFAQTAAATGGWARISRRVELSAGYYPSGLLLGFSGTFSAGDEAFFDDVNVIDLTDLFGAGNEPTLEWCDENIEYFNTAAAVNEVKGLMFSAGLETVVTT